VKRSRAPFWTASRQRTIIGVPLGLANFKLITVGLRPFGREIVSAEEARRRGMPAAVVPTPSG
jgi:uncharacterized membrane protein YccF (DUF307 family)